MPDEAWYLKWMLFACGKYVILLTISEAATEITK